MEQKVAGSSPVDHPKLTRATIPSMKQLLAGIVLIIVVGFGGFIYRNAIEHPSRPIACTLDAKVCPDGSSVGRSGPSCSFASCPPPNVSFAEFDIAFAIPEGFLNTAVSEGAVLAEYKNISSTTSAIIVVHRYVITASSTARATIQATAIGGASGEPVSDTRYSQTTIGAHRFVTVPIERFEAVVNTAYYLARESDVLRFDAIDHGVINWTDPSLDIESLPAAKALRELLTTLRVGT